MKAKSRVSLYVCTNATGSLKVPMSVVGTAANPRCFRNGAPTPSYFSQKVLGRMPGRLENGFMLSFFLL